MNKLLTVSEVAKLLGVNRNFVYKLIKEGELQSYKIGSVKVRTEDLEVYIQKVSRMKEALLELLDGLEYSLDENGSICFGNEESYREFFRRAEEMAKRYGKENSN